MICEEISEEGLLELLEIYMELVEKQDVAIYHMSKVISKQATEIQHYKNLHEFLDFPDASVSVGLESDKREVEEALAEYEKEKQYV